MYARTRILTVLLALAGWVPLTWSADAPVRLTWRQLMPVTSSGPAKAPILPSGDGTEGGWMSQGLRSSVPVEIVSELNGRKVKLGGYVVPLDFKSTHVTEFLLVPYVGACIHVPPPPVNQIVYVKLERGFPLKALFAPVFVTGTMKADLTQTELADAGYSIVAESVEDIP